MMHDRNGREIVIGSKVRHVNPPSKCIVGADDKKDGRILPGTMSVGFEGIGEVTAITSSHTVEIKKTSRRQIPVYSISFLEVVE